MSEKEFIESLVPNYITSDQSSQTRLMRDMIIKTFSYFIEDPRAKEVNVLELGCEVGYMSAKIAPFFKHLDIVDGSETFLDRVRKLNLPNVTCINKLFEEIDEKDKYTYVFASHVLEHVVDVQAVLQRIKDSMVRGGYLFAIVPNAKALSRQLADCMGIIQGLYKLTPNDIRGGHRRVYDRYLLMQEIRNSRFIVKDSGGIFLKPFADFQMDKLIDIGIVGAQQQEGLYRLGKEYPDLCADVYVTARKQ